ncbi:glutamate receptor ionotropic, delta-2-like [Panulirus ornatus]|uniref:glutamate receptor ionotropic, delta-2-like n=1 Tax=Panulirus ornatus TaxID=150431 RepID=UPI003A85D557
MDQTTAASDDACLTVAILNYEPYWNVRGKAPMYSVTGVMPVIYDILAQHFGFCYRYVVPGDLMYGSVLSNGTVTGQVGLVNRTEAEVSGVLSYTSNRATAVDFSEPLYIDEISVAYRRPVLQADILAFIKPFTLAVRSREDGSGEDDSMPVGLLASAERSIMWTLSVLLAEAFPWTPRGLGLRLVCGVWLVVALIVGTIYRSNLKAMLILPKVDLPFNTLDQLVSTKIPVYIIPSSAIYRAIMRYTSMVLIRGLKEFGILNYQLQSAIPHSKECIKPITNTATNTAALRSLDLVDYFGVFSVLGTGLLLAGIAFVLELLWRPKRSPMADPTPEQGPDMF